jgi:hypothetical protein
MGEIIRPKPTVLPDSALVPDRNIVRPPPTKFTHEVVSKQPYYYIGPQQSAPPEGSFPAGTKLKVLGDDGEAMCQVVDARGLSVVTARKGLRRLRARKGK